MGKNGLSSVAIADLMIRNWDKMVANYKDIGYISIRNTSHFNEMFLGKLYLGHRVFIPCSIPLYNIPL